MKNINDELRDLSPRLADLQKQDDGMRVPEHYFENLEAEIFQKLNGMGARRKPIPRPAATGKLTAWVSSFWDPQKAKRLAVGIAAVLLLGVSALWFFWPGGAAANSETAIAQISEEEIESFVLENLQNFEIAQIAPETVETEFPAPADDSDDAKIENLKSGDEQFLLEEMSDSELEELL